MPCYAEKIASNFQEAMALATENKATPKYKYIRDNIMGPLRLRTLEWCIEENNAWNGASFNLVFELNYQGDITRSFKNSDSPVAECFILNINKTGYPEPRVPHYYVAAPVIMLNGQGKEKYSSSYTEEDLKKLGSKIDKASSYNSSQEKWLQDNAFHKP